MPARNPPGEKEILSSPAREREKKEVVSKWDEGGFEGWERLMCIFLRPTEDLFWEVSLPANRSLTWKGRSPPGVLRMEKRKKRVTPLSQMPLGDE